MLEPTQYTGLKQPLGWSKEKWFWGKDKDRAANMMRWQQTRLHAPLTTQLARIMDTVQLKTATAKIIHSFDTVQKFMAQRYTRNMDLRLYELLCDGVSVPETRDEIYLVGGNPLVWL